MTPKPRDYDSTIARVAGNIASGLVDSHRIHVGGNPERMAEVVSLSVYLARAIVAEVKRTDPQPRPEPAPQEPTP